VGGIAPPDTTRLQQPTAHTWAATPKREVAKQPTSEPPPSPSTVEPPPSPSTASPARLVAPVPGMKHTLHDGVSGDTSPQNIVKTKPRNTWMTDEDTDSDPDLDLMDELRANNPYDDIDLSDLPTTAQPKPVSANTCSQPLPNIWVHRTTIHPYKYDNNTNRRVHRTATETVQEGVSEKKEKTQKQTIPTRKRKKNSKLTRRNKKARSQNGGTASQIGKTEILKSIPEGKWLPACSPISPKICMTSSRNTRLPARTNNKILPSEIKGYRLLTSIHSMPGCQWYHPNWPSGLRHTIEWMLLTQE